MAWETMTFSFFLFLSSSYYFFIFPIPFGLALEIMSARPKGKGKEIIIIRKRKEKVISFWILLSYFTIHSLMRCKIKERRRRNPETRTFDPRNQIMISHASCL